MEEVLLKLISSYFGEEKRQENGPDSLVSNGPATKKFKKPKKSCKDLVNDKTEILFHRIPLALALLVLRMRNYDVETGKQWLFPIRRKIKYFALSCPYRDLFALNQELSKAKLDHLISDSHIKRRTTQTEEGRVFQSIKGCRISEIADKGVLLSGSSIWNSSFIYYKNEGMKAWSSNDVPYEISSCNFTVRNYADRIVRFLASRTTSDEKTFVIDVGCGHCMFAYRLAQYFKSAGKSNITTVMSDFHSAIIDVQMKKPNFSSLVEEGYLDAALIDLKSLSESSKPINLFSGRSLHGAQIVVIANYVFDSLPQDIFSLLPSGELRKGVVTTKWYKSKAMANPHSMRIHFEDMSAGERHEVFNSLPCLRKELLTPNLCADGKSKGCIFLFPTAGIRAVKHLVDEFPSKNVLLLVGDKMVDSLDRRNWLESIPAMEQHGRTGCLSMGLDAVVLEKGLYPYCISSHHDSLYYTDEGFSISSYLLSTSKKVTESKAKDKTIEFNPNGLSPSGFQRLAGWIKELDFSHLDELTISDVTIMLRDSCYDYQLFLALRWRKGVIGEKHNAHIHQRVWLNCYDNGDDLSELEQCKAAFSMAQFLYVCGNMDTVALEILESKYPHKFSSPLPQLPRIKLRYLLKTFHR